MEEYFHYSKKYLEILKPKVYIYIYICLYVTHITYVFIYNTKLPVDICIFQM